MHKNKIVLLTAGLLLLLVLASVLYQQLGKTVDRENLGTQKQ